MNCEMFRELMFDYVSGAVDADSLVDFRKHYGGCTACAATMRMIEAQETILTSLPRPKAPPTLWGRIQDQVRDREMLETLEATPRFRLAGWAAAAAALLIALGTVFIIGGTRPPAPEPELRVRVVDIAPQQPDAAAIRRLVPGYENARPANPLADSLMGTNR